MTTTRIVIEADIHPVKATPAQRLVRTPTGILIGCAYRAPAPQPTADAEQMQAALLGQPAYTWHDKVIFALCGVVGAGLLLDYTIEWLR